MKIVENKDILVKCQDHFPLPLDRKRIVKFDLPTGSYGLIDLSKTQLFAGFQLVNIDGSAQIGTEQKFTIVEEPLLNCVKAVTVTIGSRPVYKIDSYNFCNYINKLSYSRQSLSEDDYFGLTGFGLDTYPLDDPTIGNQKRRYENVQSSIPWFLKGPLFLPPFQESSLLPANLKIGIELELDNTDFMIFRNEDETPYILTQLIDFGLSVNYSFTANPISLKSAIKIPYQHQQIQKYFVKKGEVMTKSGHVTLPKCPSKLVVFFTPQNLNDQSKNPFDFKGYGCEQIVLKIDGRERLIDLGAGLEDYSKMYYQTFKGLSRNGEQIGFGRVHLDEGYFVFAIDLIKDDYEKHDGCTLSIRTKHHTPFDTAICVNCMFYYQNVFSVSPSFVVQNV